MNDSATQHPFGSCGNRGKPRNTMVDAKMLWQIGAHFFRMNRFNCYCAHFNFLGGGSNFLVAGSNFPGGGSNFLAARSNFPGGSSNLYGPHCNLSGDHCKLYDARCNLYGVHFNLYGAHCKVYGAHSNFSGAHSNYYAGYSILHMVSFKLFTESVKLSRAFCRDQTAGIHAMATCCPTPPFELIRSFGSPSMRNILMVFPNFILYSVFHDETKDPANMMSSGLFSFGKARN